MKDQTKLISMSYTSMSKALDHDKNITNMVQFKFL